MAELTQEDKNKLWENIKTQWDVKKGKSKGDPKQAEKQINKIQELLGLDVTDFEEETPTKEIKEYTLAQAEELLGEDNIKIIDEGLDFAIAYRTIVADLTPKKDKSLKGNPAGIGQMVNISYDRIKSKLK